MEDKPNTEEVNPLVGHVRSLFQEAETSKSYDEKRWLKAYRNYRGLYGPDMAFRDNEKSKVFVKIKKIYNNLFNNNKNKKYGETDLLKGGNQYYPPKP